MALTSGSVSASNPIFMIDHSTPGKHAFVEARTADDNQFRVESILAERKHHGRTQYLVAWLGPWAPKDKTSWVYKADVGEEIVQAYDQWKLVNGGPAKVVSGSKRKVPIELDADENEDVNSSKDSSEGEYMPRPKRPRKSTPTGSIPEELEIDGNAALDPRCTDNSTPAKLTYLYRGIRYEVQGDEPEEWLFDVKKVASTPARARKSARTPTPAREPNPAPVHTATRTPSPSPSRSPSPSLDLAQQSIEIQENQQSIDHSASQQNIEAPTLDQTNGPLPVTGPTQGDVDFHVKMMETLETLSEWESAQNTEAHVADQMTGPLLSVGQNQGEQMDLASSQAMLPASSGQNTAAQSQIMVDMRTSEWNFENVEALTLDQTSGPMLTTGEDQGEQMDQSSGLTAGPDEDQAMSDDFMDQWVDSDA